MLNRPPTHEIYDTAPAAAQSPVPMTPYSQPDADAEADIAALENELFTTMQTNGVEAAFAFALPEYLQEPNVVDAVRYADETCKNWFSLSKGDTHIFSAHAVRKYYYTMADSCKVQWVVTYIKTPSGWVISTLSIWGPSDVWKY